jgi:hypothetical protein
MNKSTANSGKTLTLIYVFSFSLLFLLPLQADVVIFQSGKVVTGTVLQQDEDGVLIQMDYGTFRYPASWVKDVQKEKTASPAEPHSTARIPNWSKIISALVTNSWVHELKQIPATVIDNGVLQDVPYISFHCNSDGYEINIYGDLDNPAGFEIGAINYLVKSDAAKNNCVNFICSVLTRDDDKNIVRALSWKPKDLQKKDGVTFETTLPSEPDSYGGWWVSVYSESALTNARASGAELLRITQPRIVIKPQPIVTESTAPTTWSADDLSYSRPSTAGTSSGGGEVYVRGYYRKDGTYVHAYTRSR